MRWFGALVLGLVLHATASGGLPHGGVRRRPQPDYAGRAPPSPRAGDVLIWVPRILFYPIHRVLDSFVRWPVWRLAGVVERYHLDEWARRIFTWREGAAGIFPTFYFEFGLDPSVGFYFFHDDLLLPGHQLVLRGGFWNESWINLAWESRQRLLDEENGALVLGAGYLARPDRRFFGVGPATSDSMGSYYAINRVQAYGRVEVRMGGVGRVTLRAGYRRVRFGAGEDPSIEQRFDTADPTQVPGFGGYSLLRTGLSLRLDSRPPELSASGTGAQLAVHGHFGLDPGRPELHFVRWGVAGGGFWDVTGWGHVLGAHLLVAFVEPTGGAPVPFSELAVLGGRSHMRGFLPGRFRGPSALELSLTYRYPIWAYFDAEIFLEAGNAFDRHLRDFALDRLFLGWGLALRSHTRRDLSFDIILGFGSNRLDSADLTVESVHFAMGITTAW